MKVYIKSSVSWDYFSKPEFKKILNEYLPDYGEGHTMANQIATAVNRLVYRWYNDGDVYDNHWYGMNYYDFTNDLSDVGNWLSKNVKDVRGTLLAVHGCDSESDYEDILKNIADTLLNDSVMSRYSDRAAVGSIYNCNGPFSVEEDYEDRDYEDENYDD